MTLSVHEIDLLVLKGRANDVEAASTEPELPIDTPAHTSATATVVARMRPVD
jgi:hypothetical protein